MLQITFLVWLISSGCRTRICICCILSYSISLPLKQWALCFLVPFLTQICILSIHILCTFSCVFIIFWMSFFGVPYCAFIITVLASWSTLSHSHPDIIIPIYSLCYCFPLIFIIPRVSPWPYSTTLYMRYLLMQHICLMCLACTIWRLTPGASFQSSHHRRVSKLAS